MHHEDSQRAGMVIRSLRQMKVTRRTRVEPDIGDPNKKFGSGCRTILGPLGENPTRSRSYSVRSPTELHGRPNSVALNIAPMGASTRQFQPWGHDYETLTRYESGTYALLAECQTPGCGHTRRMVIAMLIGRCRKGANATLGEVRQRLRCYKCDKKFAAFKVFDGGHSRDGR